MGRDLGTYHIKVELNDRRGWIAEHNTGAYYTNGCGSCYPSNATRIEPIYDTEDDLIENVLYLYTEGNYGCDCNKQLFLARSLQQPENNYYCGNELTINKLTIIRPDGTEKIIYDDSLKDCI